MIIYIMTDCLVSYLSEQGIDEDTYVYKKTVTQCNCPEHTGITLVEPPTIKDLHSAAIMVMFDLFDWAKVNPGAEPLYKFIRDKCIAETPDSLFTILETLDK